MTPNVNTALNSDTPMQTASLAVRGVDCPVTSMYHSPFSKMLDQLPRNNIGSTSLSLHNRMNNTRHTLNRIVFHCTLKRGGLHVFAYVSPNEYVNETRQISSAKESQYSFQIAPLMLEAQESRELSIVMTLPLVEHKMNVSGVTQLKNVLGNALQR